MLSPVRKILTYPKYTRIRILQKKFIKNCFWLKFFLRFVYVLVYGFKAMVKQSKFFVFIFVRILVIKILEPDGDSRLLNLDP